MGKHIKLFGAMHYSQKVFIKKKERGHKNDISRDKRNKKALPGA